MSPKPVACATARQMFLPFPDTGSTREGLGLRGGRKDTMNLNLDIWDTFRYLRGGVQ